MRRDGEAHTHLHGACGCGRGSRDAVLATTRFEVPYDAKPTAGTAVTLARGRAERDSDHDKRVFTVTDVDEAAGVCCGFFK